MDSGTPSGEPIGLRERRAASTRLAVVEALSSRLVTRSLSEISVDELAAAAGISRMTFFNHFPTKEHALEHLFVVWLYREQCDARRQGLTGVAEIVHFFDAMGRWVQGAPNLARQVMAFFAGRPPARELIPFTRADRELVAPELAHEPLQFGRYRFPAATARARRDGEIDLDSTDDDLGHMLGVLAFGGALVGHSDPKRDWVRTYRHNALRALGLDLDWAPKRPGPARDAEASGTRASGTKVSGKTKVSQRPRGGGRKR